jgi:hypothetical protein
MLRIVSGVLNLGSVIPNPIQNVEDYDIRARMDVPFFDIVFLTIEHIPETRLEIFLP